jgi:HSP20 family molecular chaperone IbpA
MAMETTVWRHLADFGELRHRVDQMLREMGGGEEEKGDYMRRERRCGSFSRSMSLPAGVKAEDIQSTTEDGVLEVTIPLPEAEQKNPVEIETTPKAS